MNRDEMLGWLRDRDDPWDIVIIGGGATGLGAAVDAASRGYATALFERSDFAKGTSSRSTKLVHGGVRYLRQGNVSLVMEALHERGVLRRNAPHLVEDLAFIAPSYEWWESPFYGIGLKVYDLLAGRYGFGRSRHLSRDEVIEEIPSIRREGLRGGTLYYDGQFDDARLAVNLAQTASEQGAVVLNYAPVVGLRKDASGVVQGVEVRDEETGESLEVGARVVVNATGPFVDEVRKLDHAGAKPIIAPSQGVHIVLDKSFLPGDSAIMVPHVAGGRVMFAIPWHDVAVVGTTDTPIDDITLEPRALRSEIDEILELANRYLETPVTESDIRSVFTGIRPLVKAGNAESTAAISREHSILVDPDSGLLTVAGGKWTTYRKMAKDVVNHASALAGLAPTHSETRDLPIHGADMGGAGAAELGRLAFYGADAHRILELISSEPGTGDRVHPDLELTKAEVVWACREEMARTVDDVLARRSRSLLFDARAAARAAEPVARLIAEELGREQAWIRTQVNEFETLAKSYLPPRATRRPPSELCVMIDFSAASTPGPRKPTADRCWIAWADAGTRTTERPDPEYFRTRHECFARLSELLLEHRDRRVLVGIDFPIGMPLATDGRPVLPEGRELLALFGELVEDAEDDANNRFEVAGELNRRIRAGAGAPSGPFWGHPPGREYADLRPTRPAETRVREYRRVDQFLRDAKWNIQSVWKLSGAGAVGSQSVLGLAWLDRLLRLPEVAPRARLWPFEPSNGRPDEITIAEIWPTLADFDAEPYASRYDVRDARQVAALRDEFLDADQPWSLNAMETEGEGWIAGVDPSGPAPAPRAAGSR